MPIKHEITIHREGRSQKLTPEVLKIENAPPGDTIELTWKVTGSGHFIPDSFSWIGEHQTGTLGSPPEGKAKRVDSKTLAQTVAVPKNRAIWMYRVTVGQDGMEHGNYGEGGEIHVFPIGAKR